MTSGDDFRWPANFWWGTAASATQTEGASPADDWHGWERAGKAPPSGDGNGFAARCRQDFALLAGDLGVGHHRLSLDWARLEPAAGQHDRDEVERYRRMLVAAREAGLAPWVCLFHTAAPVWFARLGGFASADGASAWARHVEFAAESFGDLVHGWMPVNGPSAYALRGYLTGTHPPGVASAKALGPALAGVHRANFEAALTLRRTGRPVASVQALAPVFAADDSTAAQQAAAMLDGVLWDSWLRLAKTGPYVDAFDVHGFSYYFAAAVDATGSPRPYPAGASVGPLGYAPWPDGLGLVLDRLAAELPGRRLAVAELGYGGADDQARVAYLRGALAQVRRALLAGVDVAGVFFWTGVDNYEWEHGFDVPFGLYDRDRRPRPSAAVVRELIRRTSQR